MEVGHHFKISTLYFLDNLMSSVVQLLTIPLSTPFIFFLPSLALSYIRADFLWYTHAIYNLNCPLLSLTFTNYYPPTKDLNAEKRSLPSQAQIVASTCPR